VSGSTNKWLKRFKKWHRWPALIFGFFIICWAVSGVIMNHRELISGIDIGRTWMADEYQYQNWNNAAVKSYLHLSSDSILVYGNIGIWLTTDNYQNFKDFNQGFSKGIDNRKIYSMIKTKSGNIYAGTLFGLYYRDETRNEWMKIDLDVENEHITSFLEFENRLLIMTRSEVLLTDDNPYSLNPESLNLKPPFGYDNRASLFKTFWVIHSGEIYGIVGKLVIDILGILVVVLTITGIIHLLSPYLLRRKKRKQKNISRLSATKRISVKWHKQVGIVIVVLIIINSVTGMFLRPPLLIPIANTQIAKIKYSSLDHPNPWHDKLRAILYDEDLDGFLVGTNEGIYFADKDFEDSLVSAPVQPPLSIIKPCSIYG